MAHWRGTGFCGLIVRDGEYRFPPEAHARLLADWQRGAAFLEGTGLFGERIVLKGGTVEAVQLWTSEQWEEWLEEKRADKRDAEREM